MKQHDVCKSGSVRNIGEIALKATVPSLAKTFYTARMF